MRSKLGMDLFFSARGDGMGVMLPVMVLSTFRITSNSVFFVRRWDVVCDRLLDLERELRRRE